MVGGDGIVGAAHLEIYVAEAVPAERIIGVVLDGLLERRQGFLVTVALVVKVTDILPGRELFGIEGSRVLIGLNGFIKVPQVCFDVGHSKEAKGFELAVREYGGEIDGGLQELSAPP